MLKKKDKIIKEFQRHTKDTGSLEIQVALYTKRIDQLLDHLKRNVKDNSSRQGLLKIVHKRRKILGFLMRKDEKKYKELIKKLNITQ